MMILGKRQTWRHKRDRRGNNKGTQHCVLSLFSWL
jgi:hypothetical protein